MKVLYWHFKQPYSILTCSICQRLNIECGQIDQRINVATKSFWSMAMIELNCPMHNLSFCFLISAADVQFFRVEVNKPTSAAAKLFLWPVESCCTCCKSSILLYSLPLLPMLILVNIYSIFQSPFFDCHKSHGAPLAAGVLACTLLYSHSTHFA